MDNVPIGVTWLPGERGTEIVSRVCDECERTIERDGDGVWRIGGEFGRVVDEIERGGHVWCGRRCYSTGFYRRADREQREALRAIVKGLWLLREYVRPESGNWRDGNRELLEFLSPDGNRSWNGLTNARGLSADVDEWMELVGGDDEWADWVHEAVKGLEEGR